jgi:hypothetical protein
MNKQILANLALKINVKVKAIHLRLFAAICISSMLLNFSSFNFARLGAGTLCWWMLCQGVFLW